MLLNAAAILAALATGCAGMRILYLGWDSEALSLIGWLWCGAVMMAHILVPAFGVIAWRREKPWWPALPLLSLTLSALAAVLLSVWLKRDMP